MTNKKGGHLKKQKQVCCACVSAYSATITGGKLRCQAKEKKILFFKIFFSTLDNERTRDSLSGKAEKHKAHGQKRFSSSALRQSF